MLDDLEKASTNDRIELSAPYLVLPVSDSTPDGGAYQARASARVLAAPPSSSRASSFRPPCLLCFRHARMNSTTPGSTEITTMAPASSVKFSWTNLQVAEQPSSQQENQYPSRAPSDVVHAKPPVAHLADARDKWRKRANDRNESRKHDGDAAVVIVELLGMHRCFLFSSHDFSLENTFGPTKYPIA